MMNDRLYLNGINATTGQYLVPPLELPAVAKVIKDRQVPDRSRNRDRIKILRAAASRLRMPHFGLPLDMRPEVVQEAGWAIVFHKNEDPAVRKALEPLIERRRSQIANDAICKILEYQEGEGWSEWLSRHEVAPGSVEPTRIPYYVLLVGSPERIPFSFSQQLDVEYGVGRIDFDSPDDYAHYANSVVQYETASAIPTCKEALFFAPRHDFDAATQMSADLLVEPLADGALTQRRGFRTAKISADQATKQALSEVLERPEDQVPAFLFSASHGMGWTADTPGQKEGQGALLCQDWPGFGSISADHYFAAADLSANAHVHGMMAFFFACFGAGTPSHDRFWHEPGQPPAPLTSSPFIAALPKRLLSRGALACIGHIERAWGYSIAPPGVGPQLLPFQNAIGRILLGQPIGHALKDFNERFATLSTDLSSTLERAGFGQKVPDYELATSWINRNDAEGYTVIGDPAVQLRVGDLR